MEVAILNDLKRESKDKRLIEEFDEVSFWFQE